MKLNGHDHQILSHQQIDGSRHLFISSVGGNVKNKAVLKLLKARHAVDDYRKKRSKCLNVQYVSEEMEKTFTAEQLKILKTNNLPRTCPGTDCPDVFDVILGDRGAFNKHVANINFRDFLIEKRFKEEHKAKPRKLGTSLLDEIINECIYNNGCKFTVFDKKVGWYAYIDASNDKERSDLRKKISQLMRDERKRSIKAASTSSSKVSPLAPPASPAIAAAKLKRGISSVFTTTTGADNNNSSSTKDKTADDFYDFNSSNIGIDPKRFKNNRFSFQGCGK